MSANHCIHVLLPSIKSSGYSLRAKGHPYQLPRCEYELHKSLLFLDVCIEIVTVKQPAFSLFAFMCVYLCVFMSILICAFFSFFSRVSDYCHVQFVHLLHVRLLRAVIKINQSIMTGASNENVLKR